MANTNNPSITVLSVNIAAGVKQTFDNIGIQRAIMIPQNVVDKNITIKFGPQGTPFKLVGFTSGIYFNLGADFDEMDITNNGAAAAQGDIVLSPCEDFLVVGV